MYHIDLTAETKVVNFRAIPFFCSKSAVALHNAWCYIKDNSQNVISLSIQLQEVLPFLTI